MNDIDIKRKIENALHAFSGADLVDCALNLFGSIGYNSEKRPAQPSYTPSEFLDIYNPERKLNPDKALLSQWESIHFLFQLTSDEIKAGSQLVIDFGSNKKVDNTIMESYLFFAVELSSGYYTRTQLASITRQINKLFPQPAMILFRHGDTLTFSIINRRLHKRDESKDVLEKVTLIKDINFASPHRAHIEILFDLSLDELYRKYEFTNIIELHGAWGKTLNIQSLNKQFFIEVRNWFYWARLHAHFPAGAKKDEGGDSEALIRLLTRMIFCWFLKEKKLIPENFFAPRTAEGLLKDWHAADCDKDLEGRFYKAILQNLFFATLATTVPERKFRTARAYQGRNKDYGDQRFFRHVGLFVERAPVEELYKSIPFLNGGLFENLDEIPGQDPDVERELRVDGFSDFPAKQPLVPDFLFFGDERAVPELGPLLGESGSPKARGLLRIFHDYKFTVEENTPLEEDLALDPELLGRAFENLLAVVNRETNTVARKSTGSFYTPRDIVQYMVSEALFRHLYTALASTSEPKPDLGGRLRELISEEGESHSLDRAESDAVVAAISRLRILDPACGSGAFPMGLLHLLVRVLRKLDPHNEGWKAAKLAALPAEMREKAEEVFREESFDYTRKLELVKDCIHGVDIQPAAVQISKLRFFLSLVIEQKDPSRLRPLPNLETKFVCANALLGLKRPGDLALLEHQIAPKERELLDTRSRYFFAQTKREKDDCKARDRRLRRELSDFIRDLGGDVAGELASAVAAWHPYRGERAAGYFDPESMFGIRDGFDITIGNPPYVRADEQSEWNQDQRRAILGSGRYETLWEKWDLFVPFIERSFKLLRPGGISTLIVSDAFCHSKYAQKPQDWYLKNARILRLDFCSDLQIFDAAVHNLIYFFQNAGAAGHAPERRLHRETFGNVAMLPSEQQARSTYRVFFPENTATQTFAAKTVTLDRLCYVSYGLRPNSDENEAKGEFTTADLVSETRDCIHCRPYVEGKHLGPWLPVTNLWIEWGTTRAPSRFCRPTFPELYVAPEKILAQRSPGPDPVISFDAQQLVFTPASVGFVPWHALARVRNNSLKKAARYRLEKPPRPDLPNREELEATSRRFSLKYLLGVMNSTAAREFLRANRRSNIHLYPDDWKRLPIPDVSLERQQPVIDLVDQILTKKRAEPSADISALEQQLDQLVSRLYGSTGEEMALVEQDTAGSK